MKSGISQVRNFAWHRSPTNFWWLEPGPSQKLLDGGAGAWNLGSGSTDIVCGCTNIKMVLSVFNGPSRSGSGAKNFRSLEPEPEIWVPASQPWLEHAPDKLVAWVRLPVASYRRGLYPCWVILYIVVFSGPAFEVIQNLQSHNGFF